MKQFVGIGYRKDFGDEFLESENMKPSFIELAPENWMNIGGYWKKILKRLSEKYPITSHGLSLSIGSPDELDWNFLKNIKQFLEDYNVTVYSEHLSYSKCSNAHLYDLLPIPFRFDAVKHIAERIMQVQDFLKREIAMEIVSYYTPVAAEMSEVEFINSIVKESGCNLLLDVNNVYVNSFNHKYDAENFIDGLPLHRVAYIHMAGHEKVADDLIIDTHGQPIIDPVYKLFEYTVNKMQSPVPVLLERDFNIPEFEELASEMNKLEQICKEAWSVEYVS
jgi:uncharacterized protein (UPF0276 family)